MDAAKIKKAREIFERTIGLPLQEREAILSEQCAADPDLRAFVERLLTYESAALEGFLSDPAFTPAPDEAATAEPGPPECIGHYRVLRTLGEGGMGAVYLAEQTEPLRRHVALKVIKPGMDTKQVVARFESERQALALLNHPNVARVFDAGRTEGGRPYFVMEYVPGVMITEFCDAHCLTVPERLDLFMQVCDAIQHAHHNGIIHRDIKPSNLLIMEDNGGAVPKVIDFGVAKAIGGRLTESTLFTEHGQLIGTPAYMSPEQAGWGGQEVDTRTDIYSLGALLYELLTGLPLFEPHKLRDSPFDEICRTIREDDPPKPSTRFNEAASGRRTPTADSSSAWARGVARQRRTQPASLTKLLRGDLDWITMKATEKDRARRYTSASGLAADIVRHLNHEPVVAGPPRAGYRLRKFARRHRAFVTGAATVTAVLVAGIVFSTVFAIGQARARAEAEAARHAEAEQRQLAEEQRARAETELAKSQQVVRFTEEMLAGIDPGTAGDLDKTLVRMILDQAAERIETELADQPEVEAQIRFTIGKTYWSLGLFQAAEPHLQGALEIRREILGDEHLQTLEVMIELGALYREQSRYEEAEDVYTRVHDFARRAHGDEHRITLEATQHLALLHQLQGRYDDAERLHQRVLSIGARTLGEEHSLVLAAMYGLASVYQKQGRYAEAEPLLLTTLDGRRRVLGEENPHTISSLAALARLYRKRGRYAEAEPLAVKAVEDRRRMLGDEHPRTVSAMAELAQLYVAQGRLAEAEPLYRETLEVQRRVLGDEHMNTLTLMANLAEVYHRLGRYDKAQELYEGALEAQRRVLGPDHPYTLATMDSLGWLQFIQHRHAEAEPLMLATLDGRRRVLGEDHVDTISTTSKLALLYAEQGRYDEAESLLLRVLEAFQRTLGDDHPKTLTATYNLATFYLRQDRHLEAEPLAAATVATARRTLPAGHWQTGVFLTTHGATLAEHGRYDEAEAALHEAHEILSAALAEDHWRTINAARWLANMYKTWGKPEQADEWRAKLPATQPATADTEAPSTDG